MSKQWFWGVLAFVMLVPMSVQAQKKPAKQKITNRYSMVLHQQEDGTYRLASPHKFKFINLDSVPDLLTVYQPRPIASSKHYKLCVTEEYVYKSYPDYELKLSVDRAVSDTPAPFVVYIHGGGWMAGNKEAFRVTSQFLAVQKGIAGIRINYSLAGQPNATIELSMEDIRDAVKWVQQHAEELNIDPSRFGFCGASAGGHLSAAAAMSIKGATAMVGYAGVYNFLSFEPFVTRNINRKRQSYFFDSDQAVLKRYSPVYMIPKKHIPATMLFCGTGDVQVDYTQSVEYANALQQKGGEVDLRIYPYYDHGLSGKRSDKGREILMLTADFFVKQLKKQ